MADRDPQDVVRLRTAPNPPTAHIWQQALAAEGIQSEVVGDYLDAGFGDVPGVSAELWVHRDDVAAAEAVLNSRAVVDEEAADEPEA
ncbi:MAG TPA: DUF2007 domain-containing protein [Gemmataceae bacterium]|nr:DUF2007 domain-containing protein [Gemmataceae bacterium]